MQALEACSCIHRKEMAFPASEPDTEQLEPTLALAPRLAVADALVEFSLHLKTKNFQINSQKLFEFQIP